MQPYDRIKGQHLNSVSRSTPADFVKQRSICADRTDTCCNVPIGRLIQSNKSDLERRVWFLLNHSSTERTPVLSEPVWGEIGTETWVNGRFAYSLPSEKLH